MTTLADALAGGARYVKWDDLGTGQSITGTIQNVEMRQARKYQSTDLDFWDDGKPKMQAVITFSTTLRDPSDPEDDGTRSVSINLWSGQKAALVAACKAAGVGEPQPGQSFTATWTSGVGRAGDPRIFSYTLGAAPAGLGLGVDTSTGEISQPAAPPTPTVDPAAAAAALANLTPEQRAALGL
jgi:hypothetical protein